MLKIIYVDNKPVIENGSGNQEQSIHNGAGNIGYTTQNQDKQRKKYNTENNKILTNLEESLSSNISA